MLSFIYTILKLLLILGVVATIHEFGHFLFAKLFKMRVNEFSIGFGPKIVQKQFKNTMYSLRCIPLGGYCAIEGEEGDSVSKDAFSSKSPLKRIIVLLAGATFNAVLALLIFLMLGLSFPKYNTTLTEIQPGSVLEQAGIKVGDTIKKIDSKNVKLQSEIRTKNVENKTNDIEVVYQRDGIDHTTVVKNAIKDSGYIGVSFKGDKNNEIQSALIDMVASGGAAAVAGIKSNDEIISINGTSVVSAAQAVEMIRKYPNTEINITVKRSEEQISKTVVPSSKRIFDLQILATQKVASSIELAARESALSIKSIVGSYVDLFRGKVKINEMSGIVGIGEVVSKTNGILEFLNLLGIISLAIGVANIMPFPPLDGGKIVLVLCEVITRKKVSPKVEAILSYIGFGVLMLLTVFVTYKDILRLL
ncbi:MAG: RIP metalloprotease RseP [Clostridia bacterium]